MKIKRGEKLTDCDGKHKPIYGNRLHIFFRANYDIVFLSLEIFAPVTRRYTTWTFEKVGNTEMLLHGDLIFRKKRAL